MDLHNLHRPTPSTTQQRSSPEQPSEQHSIHSHAPTNDQNERLRTELQHWKHETEKMDRIARSAMEKLDRKRATKQALEAEFQAARRDADAWRNRYNELSASRSVVTNNEHTLRSELEHARRELEEARHTLKLNESGSEAVKNRLRSGDEAHQKLRDLQTQLQALSARHTTTEAELAKAIARGKATEAELSRTRAQAVASIKTLEADLATAKNQAAARTRQNDLEAAKARQSESELVAARDKLRAATQEASARTTQAQECQDMLARAEQILQTCSSLHAAKDDTHPLALALKETTQNISNFLRQQGH